MQRITVKSIVTKPTKKEGTNITTIEDEKGAKMSAFNDPKLAELHTGDIIEVEVAVEGKYTNITGWKLIESKPVVVPTRTEGELFTEAKPEKPPWKDNSVSIERQVSAKLAFEFGVNADDTTPWSVEKALKQADQIYAWIHEGKLPVPVTALKPAEPASVKESASMKAVDPLHAELSRLMKMAGMTLMEQAAWFKGQSKGKTWAMLGLKEQTDIVNAARQVVDLQKDIIR